MQGAAKVGFLVVVFVALLYGAYAILGQALMKPKTNTYFAEFSDAGGITSGTTVQMAGVKIGTVQRVQLVTPRQARMTLEIDAAVKIPQGSRAALGSSLIGIGSNPVEIIPPAESTGGYYASGDTMPGGKVSALDSFLPEGRETVKELNATLAATRKLLEDQQLQKKLIALMDTSTATLDKFGNLAEQSQGLLKNAGALMGQANGLVANNQASISGAVRSASLAMADIRRSTQLLTKLIESGKYQKESLELLESLNNTAKKADDLMTGINSLVNDPAVQSDLKSTVSNINKISDSGTRIAANSEEISKNGITLSQKAIELTDKANAIAEDARLALQKVTGFFNRNPAKSPIPPLEAGLDLLRESEPNRWRMDLTGRFRLSSGFVDLGLYDAFESNKAILQLGNPLGGSADYRYGIYASKPGVGVDFRVAPRVLLRTDLFDINKPRFDFRTQLDFGNGFVGWLGLEKIFDRNSIAVGVGIRK